MKLAFSTLGCPEFGWSDVYSMAKDLGFQGIEVLSLIHILKFFCRRILSYRLLPHMIKICRQFSSASA